MNLNGILDENDYVQAMRLDKDGNIYLMGDQSVYVLDKDGNKIAQIKADTANNMLDDGNGKKQATDRSLLR